MKEVFKDCPGYEGRYLIGNYGTVWSVARNHKMKTYIDKKGYENVGFWDKDLKHHDHRVHRLVALAFIPNPKKLPEINHKNEDKLDNRVENLEWCTTSYNCRYGSRIQRRSQKMRKPVLVFDMSDHYLFRCESIQEASEKLGIYGTDISKVCLGKEKHKNYFIFKYA